MFKRFFAAAVSLAAFLFLSVPGAYAATDERENFHRAGDWGYTLLEDGTAAVSGYFGADKNVLVPEQLDGFTVTSLGGGWYLEDGEPRLYGNIHNIAYGDDGGISDSKVYSPFSGNADIVSVTVPQSVVYVGAITFKNCSSLSSVTLGDNVEILGNNCFEGCVSLTSLDLPDSVRLTDQEFCRDCAALESVTFGQNSRCEMSAFENCVSLKSVDIPESWGTIPAYCFSGCTSLAEADIPDGITEIGDSAFSGCTSLDEIVLPDSVAAVYSNAFKDCAALTSADLGSSLDTLGSRAFAGSGLKNLSVPDSLVRIGDCAFGMSESGEVDPDFMLECSEYSAAAVYASDHGIACTAANAVTGTDSGSQRNIGECAGSEKTFAALIIVLAAAAAAIVVLIILTLKNRSTDEDEEPEIAEDDGNADDPEHGDTSDIPEDDPENEETEITEETE